MTPTRRAKPRAWAAKPDANDHATMQPAKKTDDSHKAPLTWVLDAPQALRPASPPPAPTWPEHQTWPPLRSVDILPEPVEPPTARVPEPVEPPTARVPEPVEPPTARVPEPVEPPTARVPAGAYLPPSAVLPSGEAMPLATPARATPPAESGAGPLREGSSSPTSRVRLGEGSGPLGLPAELPAWVIALGAGLAALGFFMPWADLVIGGTIGSYLGQWGLASPGHVAIMALIAGLAFVALVSARLPRWVRLGWPSILLAGLVIGLVWPYLVGPLGASIGVYVVVVGAIVMTAGGLLDRQAPRHAEAATTV